MITITRKIQVIINQDGRRRFITSQFERSLNKNASKVNRYIYEMDRKQIIIAIQDLIIARVNLEETLQYLSGENLKEMEKLIDEINMTIAWMKAYNLVSNAELSFEN